MVLLIIIVGVMYIPKLFGITPMVVLSGSMEPTYRVGALVFVEDVDTSQLKQGDNVTFYLGETKTIITHRIKEINQDEQYMITKGDNNNVEDGKQLLSNVIGKANDFSIPYIGYITTFLGTTSGIITVVVIVAGYLLLSYFLERKKK